MTPPRITVIGTPGDRRVTVFAAAATAAGLPEPAVVRWADVVSGDFAIEAGSLVRLESPGEDAAANDALRGYQLAHGAVGGTAAWYAGLVAAAERVARRTAAAGGRLLTDPGELAVLFDKRLCHDRLSTAGVPVPAALGPVAGYDELAQRLGAAGWGRAFVKPRHGSSASGVVALAAARGRVHAVTSVELVRDASDVSLYNSLRVRSYDDERDVAAIVDALCRDGVHVERWVPKAATGGRVLDLRIVVIAGRATHVVARSSASPMTNLHLGNARGDRGLVQAAMGPRAWDAMLADAERAAGQFPATLQVGVDMLIAVGWRRWAVAEVNAFGDLLPGVVHDGRDTYAEQVRALLAPFTRPAEAVPCMT